MTRKIGSRTETETQNGDSTPLETVIFLGRTMARAEYDMACSNLREFFELLQSWQKGESDEPTKL